MQPVLAHGDPQSATHTNNNNEQVIAKNAFN